MADLPQGWFHHGKKILELVRHLQPKVVVELGTWRGASAITMAQVVREWGGAIYCVDTWTGDVNGNWGRNPGYPGMLAECANNMIQLEVSESIRLIPARTVYAARYWTGDIDFLYVDADHSYESTYADLTSWWQHLRPGGLIAGDDYDNPDYPGVRQAWDRFEREAGQDFQRFETENTEPKGMKLVWGIKR